MRLELHFWAPPDVADDQARADVLRQAKEWAEAEPNVTYHKILRSWRPDDRPTNWAVLIEIGLDRPAEQTSLWGVA